MDIIGVLSYIRGSSIRLYPLAAKLYDVGCAIDYFMRGMQGHLRFTPLLYYSRLRACHFRRAMPIDLSIMQAALSLQDDRPCVRTFRQFLRIEVSTPNATSYAGGSKRAYVALR
jgi:hypothetical protein